jgi:hypothetical protein
MAKLPLDLSQATAQELTAAVVRCFLTLGVALANILMQLEGRINGMNLPGHEMVPNFSQGLTDLLNKISRVEARGTEYATSLSISFPYLDKFGSCF